MNTHAIFLSFFFVLSSLVADDARKLAEQPISVIGEVAPCAFVNDTVNVVDGSFYLRMHHLSVPGHVPLDLVQYYNSQSNYSSWFGTGMSLNYSFWMQGSSDVKEGHDYMGLYAEAPGGSIIACIAKASESSQEYYLDPKVVHEHFTNCSSGHISARTNLKNTRIKEKVDDDYEWTACLADGTRRYYKKSEYQNNIVNVKEEKRRNYTSLRFDYHSGDDMLKPIKRIEAYGKSKLNWLEFDRKNKERKAKVKAANDKCAHFYSFKKDGSHYINRIVSSDCPERRFSYTKAGKYYSIDRVDMPDGRFLEVQYDDKGRVVAQKAPVGKDGDKRTIWHFDYAKEHTTVTNANGYKKVYRHKKGRISRVEEYKGESLYRTKAYYWGAKEGLSWGKQPKGDEGNLLAYATLNHEGCGVSLCYYDYDDYGNIVKETICGNLSGSYPWPFWIDDEGRPKDPNVEQYRKYYKYSSDHLLIEQSEDYGPTIEYRYKPGTDLMWAKLVKDGDKIVQREFYEHNDDGIVVEKIVDDGDSDNKSWMSGVTYRLVTHIEPVRHKEGYGQGLPQEVWENYYDLEAAKLVLLKHTHYNYNRAGSVTEEAVFDANNNYRYSTWYEYDHKNRLHKKTDPIGQVQTYVYDDNDNKTYEKQENRDVHTIFSYDKANRLIEATEYHYDNSEVNARFEYDLMGNKTASYDRYGYKTSCEYDELSRLRKIVLPKKRYTIEKEYDIFDNVVREVNPKGTATTTEYTIRKNPCRIVYEDLSQERLEYNKKGTLFKKWDRAGTRTLYRYDRLGRVVKTTVSYPEGTILLRTHNTYNGFHLLSSCDPRGTTTQYKYDYAGRKVEELIEGAKNYSKTTFEYDSLGRIGCTKRFYGKERDKFVVCYFEYDNLDRITLEKQTDSQGVCKSWTYYEYDAMGNCTLKRSGHTDEDAELQNRYNSKGELVEAQDEYGSTTKIAYNHAFSNKKGQKTLQKRVVDALGNSVEEYYDILGRLVSQVRKNPDGALTHATDYQYNATGQKIRQIERVVVDGVVDRNYEVTWKYDAQDRLIRLTEQPHTADEKVTRYSYDAAGRVAKITKPDGVVLEHTYDALSRLLTLVSSDKSVAYRYSYDRNNNIRKVVDEVTGIVTERRYDAWNRLTKDGGVHHSYDALGRLKKLTIPDGSQVAYHYGDLHLRAIERLSSDNMLLYEHRYLAFDLKHRPLVCEHIKEVGRAHVGWDKKGRNVLSDSRYYSHTILKTGFDAVGNVKNYSYSDPQGKETVFYSYDDLYQLSHEQGHEEHSYRHDSLNNRLAKDAAAYQIDSQNKIIAAESCTYSYDKNGNMTSDGTKSYSYDALDRLIKVTEGEKETCYTYDSFNRRIRRNNEQFIYQDMREIGCMQDGVVTQFRVLGIGKGAELGASIALELEGKLYCPLHDFRGNIVCLIDTATNQVSESYRYTAFGECQVYTSPDQKFNPWRFASKRFDPETGFTYFSRRYYDPTLGRFVTPDPIGFTDGPNLYAYVHNNPITNFDLFGLFTEDDRDLVEGRVKTSNGNTVECNCRLIVERAETSEPYIPPPFVKSFWTEVGKYTQPGINISAGNGMWNSESTARNNFEYLSSLANDVTIKSLYNATRGPFDVLEAGLQTKLGVYFATSKMLAQDFKEFAETHPVTQYRLHFSHSQSAVITLHALELCSQDVRNRIISVAIGPAAIIPSSMCHKSYNYVSTRDPVPFISDPLGLVGNRDSVYYLKPKAGANMFFDHSFQSPTYRAALQFHLGKYIKENSQQGA